MSMLIVNIPESTIEQLRPFQLEVGQMGRGLATGMIYFRANRIAIMVLDQRVQAFVDVEVKKPDDAFSDAFVELLPVGTEIKFTSIAREV